jgi:hypothetical protein
MLGRFSSGDLGNIQRMCYGGSPQEVWEIYSECVREVLLRLSREYTANVLGRFFSGDLGNIQEIC